MPRALRPFLKNYVRDISPELIRTTNQFVRNPPNPANSYKDFTEFYGSLALCVLRAEVDENFDLDTKTATTLAYLGSIISLGLDRAAKESGVFAGMKGKFDELMSGPLRLTQQQAADILKQENINTALILIDQYQEANNKAASINVEITEVEPIAIHTETTNKVIDDESEYAI